jgi:putative DNA primase/helicase
MPKEEAQERLKLMSEKGYPEGMFWFYSNALAADMGLPAAHLMNEKFREFLIAALKAKDIKFLFLDNLASLTRGIDENSKKDWDPVNEWLLDLRFMGVGTQMFHHESKEGKQRGHSAKEDHIDIAIRLKRPANYTPEDGCKFIAQFDKSRSLKTEQLPLIADTLFQCTEDEYGEFTWTYGNVRQGTKIEILKLLDKGNSQTEVAEELKINKSHVSRVRKQAIEEGYLMKENKLTQVGFNFVGGQQD